jgi:hypothetical protein
MQHYDYSRRYVLLKLLLLVCCCCARVLHVLVFALVALLITVHFEQSVTLLPVLIAVRASFDAKEQQAYMRIQDVVGVAARGMQCTVYIILNGCMY